MSNLTELFDFETNKARKIHFWILTSVILIVFVLFLVLIKMFILSKAPLDPEDDPSIYIEGVPWIYRLLIGIIIVITHGILIMNTSSYNVNYIFSRFSRVTSYINRDGLSIIENGIWFTRISKITLVLSLLVIIFIGSRLIENYNDIPKVKEYTELIEANENDGDLKNDGLIQHYENFIKEKTVKTINWSEIYFWSQVFSLLIFFIFIVSDWILFAQLSKLSKKLSQINFDNNGDQKNNDEPKQYRDSISKYLVIIKEQIKFISIPGFIGILFIFLITLIYDQSHVFDSSFQSKNGHFIDGFTAGATALNIFFSQIVFVILFAHKVPEDSYRPLFFLRPFFNNNSSDQAVENENN